MSREINPYGLRMPPELKARLEDQAHEHRRSLNAEIVSRLEASFGKKVPQKADVVTVKPGAGLLESQDTTASGVDRAALRAAIEMGERYLENKGLILTADKRSVLFDILYDLLEGQDKNDESAVPMVEKVLELVL